MGLYVEQRVLLVSLTEEKQYKLLYTQTKRTTLAKY